MTGLVLGEIWNVWFPINKKLWTSSYVLFAAGCTLLLLSLCYWLLDVKQWRGRWTWPLLVLGSNAITAYLVSELLAGGLEAIKVQCGGEITRVPSCIYNQVFMGLGSPAFGALLYSIAFLLICFLPNWVLYRKRIFLRV